MNVRASVLLAVVAVAACSSSSAPPAPSVPCSSTALSPGVDTFARADVGLYLDSTDPLLSPVGADLASYLGTMWGGPVTVSPGAPDGSKRASIWLSSSDAAASALGATLTDGYAMRRTDAGGRTTLVVYAPDPADLASGAYALLEQLGARFFHPMQELVPRFGQARLPHTLDVVRHALARTRGLQPHTLHPIEYLATFMEPGAQSLAEARRFIDWLVKTGQNYVQWPLLGTVDWATWAPYASSVLDYAHSRGVRVGAVPQVWGGSSLQNNFVLVTDANQWASQMVAKLDQLVQLPWDAVELALGEFTSADPQLVIDWLDYATEYLTSLDRGIVVDVQNHVGNYPQLWVSYGGHPVFYYHLPQFCDLRLGQSVHTLSLFDLYRDWATYGHPDFHLQHDYLMGELPSRRVSYFPESAYWISADIDVPAFLPEFLYARWLDIHSLSAEISAQKLPPLDGHIQFTSGHEWGYWLTDYLVAHMLWEPDAPFDTFLQDYGSAFGSCGQDIQAALSSFVALQTTYLFDQRLLAYIQGENDTVDLGYLVGLETHPQRVEFEQLLSMSPAARTAFTTTVIRGLEDFAAQAQPLEDSVAARCRGSDEALVSWCDELWDGIRIVRLRATHAATLYRAVLAHIAGNPSGARALHDQAVSVTTQAAQVIAHRESQYRFDVGRLTSAYANPTVYPYGYLREAHTQCYWHRREQQVAYLLDNGFAAPIAVLASCSN